MSDPAATRNRLLAAVVALLAVACVLLAVLLLSPASTPAPAAPTGPARALPAPALPQPPSRTTGAGGPVTSVRVGGRDVPLDAKGLGPLGDLARRVDGDPLAVGRVDAPVVLVEYADYACPFCAAWSTGQRAQLQRYVDEGVLRIEWRDLVIFGEKSQRAAQAARAAGAQGRFWQFNEALFAASPTSGHPDLTDEVLEGFATRAGVPDLARWRRDMLAASTSDAVVADTREAQRLGARSTPAFSVNGVAVVGAQPVEVFARIIDASLRAQQGPRA